MKDLVTILFNELWFNLSFKYFYIFNIANSYITYYCKVNQSLNLSNRSFYNKLSLDECK